MAVEKQPVDPAVAEALRRALEGGDEFDRSKEVTPIPVDYDDPEKDGSPKSGCEFKPAIVRGGEKVSGAERSTGGGAKVTCRR